MSVCRFLARLATQPLTVPFCAPSLLRLESSSLPCFTRLLPSHTFLDRGYSAEPALEPVQEEAGAVPEASPSSDLEVISAVPREYSGKIISKKLRANGWLPSVVYECKDGHLGGNKELISVENKQINRLLRKLGYSFFLSRVFELEVAKEVDGEVVKTREQVLPRSVHYAPATEHVWNVTFLRVLPGERLKVNIPLTFTGHDTSPGLKRGGFLNTQRRVVPFSCPSGLIPPSIPVDLSKLDLGHRVLLKDLQVSPELRLVPQDPNLLVCKVMGTRAEKV